MSHDWSTKLKELEAALSAQNQQLAAVKESLAELPSHASIALSNEWKSAFEEAVEPVVSVARPRNAPPIGAIRA